MSNLTSLLSDNRPGFSRGNDYTDSRLLAANVPESLTVPTDVSGLKAGYVTFGSPVAADFYARGFNDSDGADRVTNGAFATDTGWTKGTGWTIGSGVATAAGAISTALEQEAAAATPVVEGQAYLVVFTATRDAGDVTINVGGTAGTARSTAATFTEVIIAGSTQTIEFTTSSFTGTVDALTVLACASVPADASVGLTATQNPGGFLLDSTPSYVSVVSAGTPIITASFFKR